MVLLIVIGLVLAAYGFISIIQIMNVKPIAFFQFKEGANEFEIDLSGYYSISILGAGFVRTTQEFVISLSVDSKPLAVSQNVITPWFRRDNKLGVEKWGFEANTVGHCVLTFLNVDRIEVKRSLLTVERLFETPTHHNKLKVLVHRSMKPIFMLLPIIALIFGVGLISFGLMELLTQ